jgi:BMFP domain-containing protein YqiC
MENVVASVEKKRAKLQARIAELENELKLSLQKKAAGPAINVSAYTRQIASLKEDLVRMK